MPDPYSLIKKMRKKKIKFTLPKTQGLTTKTIRKVKKKSEESEE